MPRACLSFGIIMLNKKPSKMSCYLILLVATYAKAATQDNFLVITDIHLNLNAKQRMELYPKKFSHKNDLDQQTFIELIKATHNGIQKNIIVKPNFILILGDINTHKRINNSPDSNEAYVFKKLQQEFSNTPLIYVYGNNDSPQRNYGRFTWRKQSPYTTATDKANWKNGFLNTGKLCKADTGYPCISSQNLQHGYFSALIMPKLRLISLNSVLFSINNKFISPARHELNWLEQQLQTAALSNEQVIIAMHIPPGYNIYDKSPLWRSKDLARFKRIITKQQAIIIAMLSSHTHKDELKIYTTKQNKIGIFATAALSTSHGNSPSVKTFYLTKNHKHWQVDNFTTYKFNLTKQQLIPAKLYDFKAEYCQTNTQNINQCLYNLNLETLQKFMNVGNPNFKETINAPQNIFLQGE